MEIWQIVTMSASIVSMIFAIISGVSSYKNAYKIQQPWYDLYLQDRQNKQNKEKK
jgi:hypothetical protein